MRSTSASILQGKKQKRGSRSSFPRPSRLSYAYWLKEAEQVAVGNLARKERKAHLGRRNSPRQDRPEHAKRSQSPARRGGRREKKAEGLTAYRLPKKINPGKTDMAKILTYIDSLSDKALSRAEKQINREEKKTPGDPAITKILEQINKRQKETKRISRQGIKSRLMHLF